MQESSLFLGDIDPNQVGQAITARQMRQEILYSLLVWDHIVVSDSQMLQDPRFRVMMEPSEQPEDIQFDDLKDWQRGFQYLLERGLIRVARRDGKDLTETWSEMNERENGVPFLPRSMSYASRIEKIGYTPMKYELSRVANRFSQNLQEGLKKNAVPLINYKRFQKLRELMCKDSVLLADILALLGEQLEAGEITQQEMNLLYQFSFQCYSVNVPAELGCHIRAKLGQIPLFLPSGTYDGEDGTALLDQSKMQPSWALDPNVFDLLPTEVFVELRNELKRKLVDKKFDLLLKHQEGNLQSDEVEKFYEAWAEFNETLKENMLDTLRATRDEMEEIMTGKWVPVQKQFVNLEKEVVINGIINLAVDAAPYGALIRDSLELAGNFRKVRILLSQRDVPYCRELHDEIKGYLDSLLLNNISVITKY